MVYRMGRLCGGVHEISGIKAPIFLHGWVEGGGVGGVGRMVGWGWWGFWWSGQGGGQVGWGGVVVGQG